MKGNGKMGLNMDLELNNIEIKEMCMLGAFRKAFQMGTVNIFGIQERSMKENFKME